MHRWVAIALVSLCILSSCGDGGIEGRAADRLTECMLGNGGVAASDVRFEIEDDHLNEVTLSYRGQGGTAYDAVYEACLSRVIQELSLKH